MPRRVEDLRKHECVLFPVLARKGVWTLRRSRRKYSVQVAGALPTKWTQCARPSLPAWGSASCRSIWCGDALRKGELVPLLRQFQVVPESAIYLVYLPNRTLSLRVRVLIDFLAERFGTVLSWEMGW
jgi:DNA-binding transcriptional LysR family regulator